MQITKLLTYTFDKNVGSTDRVLRILSGLALVAAGVLMSVPNPWNIVLMAAGGAWAFTGVVSRCSIYYLFGHSSRRSS
ncbi:MAG: DUF2892 domain-containing protein [Rhizobiales bacterium]|nr:DUF2892 domain-containing protein [Hyphomicrobiales bacterium]